jgi:hypothetical protein
MSFKPDRGKFYHLFIQHSGMVLGVSGTERGAKLQQQKFNNELPITQQFEFIPVGNREFFIKPRFDMYLDVPGDSKDNGTPLNIWTWNNNTANQRFQFVAGPGGYYYIRCSVSGKVFDVTYVSLEDGATVAQHDQHRPDQGKHQLFRPVPVGLDYSRADAMPFIVNNTSDGMKNLVAGIAGSTPEIGSALKGLVQFLWADGQGEVMKQMRDYVEVLVKELIEQSYVKQLENHLTTLRTDLDSYTKAALGKQKSDFFSGVLLKLNDAEPYFFDQNNPQSRLPYFVALGTIALTTLREEYLFYEQIYREPDGRRTDRLADFKTKLAAYLKAAEVSRARALTWRLGKITTDHQVEHPWGVLGPTTTDIYIAQDSYSGWRFSQQYNSLTGGEPRAEANRNEAYQKHREQITAQFGAELDAYLTPSYLWKYLDPSQTAQPTRTKKELVDGPFGGRKYTRFEDAGGAPITRIVVQAGTRLDGLEIFYGGVSGGLHGWAGGHRIDVTLEPGEQVVAVYGTSGEVLHGIWFETNLGRTIGGGGGGNGWSTDAPDNLHAVMSRIAGYQGSKHIDGVSIHWEYYRDE